MGDLPFAIVIIVAVLAIANNIWSLVRPDTGIHGALRRRFSKTDLKAVETSAGVRDPIFSIPCAIGIRPGKENSIRRNSGGVIVTLPQSIHISPGPHGKIDIKSDLGYTGPSLVDRFDLAKVWWDHMLVLRNGSSHAGSMIFLKSAKIEVESYSELSLCDEKVIVLINSGYAIGGDSGPEIQTHRSNAILSRHGAIAYDDDDGAEYNAKGNLLLRKRYHLNSGDVIALQTKVYFAHAGVFNINLRVEGVDERDRPIEAKSDSVTASVVFASAAEFVSRGVRFVDIWKEQSEIIDS